MESSMDKSPLSGIETAPGQHAMDSSSPQESTLPAGADRLYQIAALAAGIILLATAV